MRSQPIVKLKKLPLFVKLALLVVFAFFLFFSSIYANDLGITLFFLLFTVLNLILALLCCFIIGKSRFRFVMHLWLLGTLFYLIIAVFRIYSGGELSFYLHLTSVYDRWLYSLILPLATLGTFSIGLIFINVVSPIEFLSWGRFGLKIVLIFRALQHSLQVFYDTKRAFMMRNMWPEENDKIFSFSGSWLALKYSPLLISTAFRNIITFWYPWGWLCLNKFHDNLFARKH